MGGKTSTSTQSVSIPPEVLARYNAVNARAENVASQGFQPYSSDPNAFVAPLTAGQQAGVTNTNQYANAAQPYYGAAANLTAAGAGPINAGELNTQKYMNPFTKNVADTTQQALQQQQEQAMSGQTGNAIRSGAFGGDRSGIAAAVAQRQNQQGMAQAIAPIYERGYSQAQQTAAQQQGVTLGAEQANAARSMQAGQQLAGLGSAAQTAGLQGAAAQLQAGQQQQQTEQAGRTAMYNQFLQQQGYPFQVAQFLANIAMGTGALSGSTTTTTQPSSMFSDRRLKHDIRKIGETNDGQPIYKFKYKGDPKEQTHIGLMAQEVEKKHPEAVGLSGGYKTVDYDKATRFAEGGLVPSSMGGAVDDDVAYEGFADGGMPSLSIFGMPGGGNSRIPAEVLMQMQNMPKRELMRPAAPPKEQPNALQQAQAGLNAGKTITEGYKTGKAALFGAAPTPDDKEGSRGLFSNTGSPGMSGGWLDTIKGWGSSATPAARGGVMGYADGGMPYGDDDTDSTDILGDVVKQGQQQHASLPKPGEAPKPPQSGVGQLAGGIKDVATIGSSIATIGSSIAEAAPYLLMLSDERAKHDKKKVGELYDGQPVYSYKYNGDNRTQLGLMAQNVERTHPEAVGSMHGMKMVDYDRATSDAADRGHFYSGGLVPRHGYAGGGGDIQNNIPEADLPAMGAQEAGLVTRFKVPEEYAPIIEQVSRDTGIPAAIIAAKIKTESNFNPNATGSAGEEGVNQILRSTAQKPGFGLDPETGNLRDPQVSIPFGARYLKARGEAAGVRDWNDPAEAAKGLAGYNGAGPQARQYAQRVLSLVRDDAGEPSGGGVMPSARRVQLAARDTGTATDAPSGFRATADDLANRFVRPSPGAGPQQGGEGLGGLMKSEKFWIPLLSGLGAMAASPSRYLGSAILTGLGGGAQAYSDLQKQQSGLESQQALTQKTYADISRDSYNDKNRTIQVIDPKTRKWVSMLWGEYLMKYGDLPPEQRPQFDLRTAANIPPAPGGVMPPPAKTDTTIETTPLVPPAPVVKPLVVESGTPEPPAKPPAAPAVEPAKPSGGMFSASDSEVEEGRKFAFNRMTMASTSPEPDLYGTQVNVARDASKQQQLLIPLTKELAAAPDSGLLEPGPLQKYMESVVAFANNAGRMFGAPEAFTSKDLQDKSSVQEVVRKLKVQLQGKQATDAQQHTLAALQTFGEGIPGTLNSKKAVAEMIPQLLTANQRELDRNAFFADYRRRAGGNTIALQDAAGATSRLANEYFDAKFGNDFYQKERNELSKMFTDKIATVDANGNKGEPISVISLLSSGSPMTDKTKKAIEAKYGTGILRYFGMR